MDVVQKGPEGQLSHELGQFGYVRKGHQRWDLSYLEQKGWIPTVTASSSYNHPLE